jgi:hypothetical protein
MKAQLPQPEHYSYKLYRKQRVSQILVPIIVAGLLLIGMIVLISVATFSNGMDTTRWAAISAIWITIPIIIGGLIFLALFVGLIYLLSRVLGILPRYTGLAQGYVYRARSYVIRLADLIVKPIFGVAGFLERIKAFFGRV